LSSFVLRIFEAVAGEAAMAPAAIASKTTSQPAPLRVLRAIVLSIGSLERILK
jgi:hypothetical protein